MLIKNIHEICNRFKNINSLNESMSFSDFRKEISESWVDKNDIKIVLDFIRSEPNLKKKYNLNDYLDLPFALIYDGIRDYENIVETEREKKNFVVVYDSSDWQLVVPLSLKASKYIAHNYLRHPGDESEFSSGPTWCTAKDGIYWKEYTEGKSYPIVYYFLSKKDSTKRFTIVFNNKYQQKEQKNLDITYNKENFEKGHTIAEMNGEIRDFSQVMSRESVIKAIEKNFNVSLNTPINENDGRLNITQIVYDNFKSLQSQFERMKTKMDEIVNKYTGYDEGHLPISLENLHRVWELFTSLKKKYGLKRGVDYHKDTLESIGAFYRYKNEGSVPTKVVDYGIFDISEDINYECFYCTLLLSLLSSDISSYCYFSLDENFQYSDERDVKAFKSITEKGKYSRLLDITRKNSSLDKNLEYLISHIQGSKFTRNNFSKYGKIILKEMGINTNIMDALPVSVEVLTGCGSIYNNSLLSYAQDSILRACDIIKSYYVISNGKLKKKPSKPKSEIDPLFDGLSLNLIDDSWRISPFYETPVIPNDVSDFIFTQILIAYKSYLRNFLIRYRHDDEFDFYEKILDNVNDVYQDFTETSDDNIKEETKLKFINYIEDISKKLSSKYKSSKISTGDVRNNLKEIVIHHHK